VPVAEDDDEQVAEDEQDDEEQEKPDTSDEADIHLGVLRQGIPGSTAEVEFYAEPKTPKARLDCCSKHGIRYNSTVVYKSMLMAAQNCNERLYAEPTAAAPTTTLIITEPSRVAGGSNAQPEGITHHTHTHTSHTHITPREDETRTFANEDSWKRVYVYMRR
jgi:hypothetical protein